MKILTFILIVIALALIVFNATRLDLEDPFEGESAVAAIGILASACVVLLLLILRTSLSIKKRKK